MKGLVAATLLFACALAVAQPREQDVKAAFLFRFLSFVEWPAQAFAGPDSPLVIGVIGADEVAAELTGLVKGRSAQNRPIAVRTMREGERPAGAHVVFVGRRAAQHIAKLAATPNVLVVAESEGALEQGAMINFLIVDGRVRFEVAPDQAERQGLRISARMLAVAQHVRPGRL